MGVSCILDVALDPRHLVRLFKSHQPLAGLCTITKHDYLAISATAAHGNARPWQTSILLSEREYTGNAFRGKLDEAFMTLWLG